jgi:hypothetical protein
MINSSIKPFGNAAMEFHDSTLASATSDVATVTMLLSPAYVHRSSGTAGVDKGTCWLQDVVMVLRGCEPALDFPKLPLALSNARATIGERTYEGVVSVPLSYKGPVSLDLSFENGAQVRLSASEIYIDLAGDPSYLEEFPGA